LLTVCQNVVHYLGVSDCVCRVCIANRMELICQIMYTLFTANQTNQPTEKERKVREEYERKLSEMQKEMKRLQSAKKEHARLLRNQTQHESQVKTLKNELAEMKRAKVSLLS